MRRFPPGGVAVFALLIPALALNVEGAWLAFVGIQRAARDAFDFLAVNRGNPIANNGYGTAHQRDVERLPLAWRSR
jgi:hypothetical protein